MVTEHNIDLELAQVVRSLVENPQGIGISALEVALAAGGIRLNRSAWSCEVG